MAEGVRRDVYVTSPISSELMGHTPFQWDPQDKMYICKPNLFMRYEYRMYRPEGQKQWIIDVYDDNTETGRVFEVCKAGNDPSRFGITLLNLLKDEEYKKTCKVYFSDKQDDPFVTLNPEWNLFEDTGKRTRVQRAPFGTSETPDIDDGDGGAAPQVQDSRADLAQPKAQDEPSGDLAQPKAQDEPSGDLAQPKAQDEPSGDLAQPKAPRSGSRYMIKNMPPIVVNCQGVLGMSGTYRRNMNVYVKDEDHSGIGCTFKKIDKKWRWEPDTGGVYYELISRTVNLFQIQSTKMWIYKDGSNERTMCRCIFKCVPAPTPLNAPPHATEEACDSEQLQDECQEEEAEAQAPDQEAPEPAKEAPAPAKEVPEPAQEQLEKVGPLPVPEKVSSTLHKIPFKADCLNILGISGIYDWSEERKAFLKRPDDTGISCVFIRPNYRWECRPDNANIVYEIVSKHINLYQIPIAEMRTFQPPNQERTHCAYNIKFQRLNPADGQPNPKRFKPSPAGAGLEAGANLVKVPGWILSIDRVVQVFCIHDPLINGTYTWDANLLCYVSGKVKETRTLFLMYYDNAWGIMSCTQDFTKEYKSYRVLSPQKNPGDFQKVALGQITNNNTMDRACYAVISAPPIPQSLMYHHTLVTPRGNRSFALAPYVQSQNMPRKPPVMAPIHFIGCGDVFMMEPGAMSQDVQEMLQGLRPLSKSPICNPDAAKAHMAAQAQPQAAPQAQAQPQAAPQAQPQPQPRAAPQAQPQPRAAPQAQPPLGMQAQPPLGMQAQAQRLASQAMIQAQAQMQASPQQNWNPSSREEALLNVSNATQAYQRAVQECGAISQQHSQAMVISDGSAAVVRQYEQSMRYLMQGSASHECLRRKSQLEANLEDQRNQLHQAKLKVISLENAIKETQNHLDQLKSQSMALRESDKAREAAEKAARDRAELVKIDQRMQQARNNLTYTESWMRNASALLSHFPVSVPLPVPPHLGVAAGAGVAGPPPRPFPTDDDDVVFVGVNIKNEPLNRPRGDGGPGGD